MVPLPWRTPRDDGAQVVAHRVEVGHDVLRRVVAVEDRVRDAVALADRLQVLVHLAHHARRVLGHLAVVDERVRDARALLHVVGHVLHVVQRRVEGSVVRLVLARSWSSWSASRWS